MITRKAILAAFELITNDKSVKTAVVFIHNKDTIFSRIERVRITRSHKNHQHFTVTFGRCNYAEREFLKKPLRDATGPIPKVMIKDWPKKKKKVS